MIAIVDYGAGNVASVHRAITHVGGAATLTADPTLLRSADMLVVPGQGHFGQAMGKLRATGLDAVLRDHAAAGRPLIGVCLGVQILFAHSEEAPGVAGLGLLAGTVRKFAAVDDAGDRVKIPQIGWNHIALTQRGTPLDAIGDDACVYFVHSYHVVPDDDAVIAATAVHGQRFVAAVARDNLFAVQFHPEKSGETGLALWSAILGQDSWRRPC